MLAFLSFLFFTGYYCSSCDDFTVGSCSPDQSQTILSLDLPNTGEQWQLCENLCNVQEDCEFWSLSTCLSTSPICKCSLLMYSYLHSCEIVGGGVDSDIEASASKSFNLKSTLMICLIHICCDPQIDYVKRSSQSRLSPHCLKQSSSLHTSSGLSGTVIWQLWRSGRRGLPTPGPRSLVRPGELMDDLVENILKYLHRLLSLQMLVWNTSDCSVPYMEQNISSTTAKSTSADSSQVPTGSAVQCPGPEGTSWGTVRLPPPPPPYPPLPRPARHLRL